MMRIERRRKSGGKSSLIYEDAFIYLIYSIKTDLFDVFIDLIYGIETDLFDVFIYLLCGIKTDLFDACIWFMAAKLILWTDAT